MAIVGETLNKFLTSFTSNLILHTTHSQTLPSLSRSQLLTGITPIPTHHDTKSSGDFVQGDDEGVNVCELSSFLFQSNTNLFCHGAELLLSKQMDDILDVETLVSVYEKNSWSLSERIHELIECMKKMDKTVEREKYYGLLMCVCGMVREDRSLNGEETSLVLNEVTSVLNDPSMI